MSEQKLPFEAQKELCFVGPLKFDKGFMKPFSPHQIIFIDGGISHCPKWIKNPFLVGDGDSAINNPYNFSFSLEKEKDFSDLSFALGLVNQKQEKVTLLGFIGGRLDHQLCVLGECHQHLKRFPGQIIHLGQNIVYYPAGTHEINLNGLFSLVSLEKAKISIEGEVKYPMKKQDISPCSSWLLSNEGRGSLSIESSAPICLLRGSLVND